MTKKQKQPKKIEKFVLITNLEYVTVNGVRTHTNALLLEEYYFMRSDAKPSCRVRGFGMDPAWPTFDMAASTIEHTLVPARSSSVMLTDEGEEPLLVGAILRLGDGGEIHLVTCDRSRPVDVQTITGDVEERVVLDVWDTLQQKVVDYWDKPGMPMLTWVQKSPLDLSEEERSGLARLLAGSSRAGARDC